MSDFVVPPGPRPPRSLAEMRERYVLGPLVEAEVAADPFTQFREWLAAAAAAGLAEPNAMVLSTADAAGVPSSRHVLLKELDDRGFVLYTNLRSRKAVELSQNPACSLCFPWFPLSRQVVVLGRAEQVDRDTAAAYWAVRPRDSQMGAWASRQSEPIASRDELRRRLARVRERFHGADVPLPDFWGGFRVVPRRVEFWQGQPGCLHDRLVYASRTHDPDPPSWILTRLQP